MRRIPLGGLIVASAVAVAVVAGAANAGRGASGVVGHVYVNDNTAGVNTVAGFDRHADGSLTPIAGLAVRGRRRRHGAWRRLAGLAPAQRRRPLPARRRRRQQPDLGAADQARRLAPDRQGSPVSSDGVNPVSIAVARQSRLRRQPGPGTNPGDTNYTGFTLNPGGHLRADPGLDLRAAERRRARRGALQRRRHQARRHARSAPRAIDSFTVGSDGRLTAAPGSPFDAQASRRRRGTASSAASSARPARTSCSSPTRTTPPASGAPGLVSSFTDDANGVLTPIGASPFAERRHRVVLGRDQPRRPLPVRREHRLGDHLDATRSPPTGALTFLQSTPARALGARRRGRAPLARRLDALGRRRRARTR